jgi:hypothetical protein
VQRPGAPPPVIRQPAVSQPEFSRVNVRPWKPIPRFTLSGQHVNTANVREICIMVERLAQRNTGFNEHVDCGVDFGNGGVRKDSSIELDVPGTMKVLIKRKGA